MEQYQGKAAVQGIAIGKIAEWKKQEKQVRREHVEDTAREEERFADAQKKAGEQLQELYDKAVIEVGEANAAIFEVHQMMLQDTDYVGSIINMIQTQQVNAEYAVATTGNNFSEIFEAMDDEYMKARAADIKDITERLVHILNGSGKYEKTLTEPSVIVADDLTPSETVQLDKSMIIAFVTRQGSVNSHTAILARTMNIPALVSTDIPENVDGKQAVVDGNKGIIIVDPDIQALDEAKAIRQAEAERQEILKQYKGKPTVTKSGREIRLYANIGGISDIGAVLQNDAAGIGLFRSEFLYLQEDDYPSEETQFQVYKQAAEMMGSKKVIIRTLDIGADKQIDYFHLEKEDNPALGYRAIRICLHNEELFKTQLRALYRASVYGNIAIMIPMIISLWEVKKVKALIAEVKRELDSYGIAYGNVEFGIMIETPAAVMISDELAKEVDFFSIGTNDLTQYTLAIDRQNPKLDDFYDSHHPAVLKMIRMVVENAHKAGIWAGICGELGADLELTETFMEMGIDELSVSPAKIFPVRKRISECD